MSAAGQDPGRSPRQGELVQVTAVGTEQVQFVFRFKAGPDPKAGPSNPARPIGQIEPPLPAVGPTPPTDTLSPRPPITPLPPAPGVDVRIDEVLFTDNRGQTFSVVDQDVRRESNVYYLAVTSAAVTPDSYRVVCQASLVVSEFQLKIAAEATRELDAWRFDTRSFKFAVYGPTERRPYQFNILHWR